jgi:hypothetical protein
MAGREFWRILHHGFAKKETREYQSHTFGYFGKVELLETVVFS